MTSYLNTENIARSKGGVEYHPLHPFLPENAKVLFLGSFPPQRKRWCMDFYYPNFINDHWRIEGQIFFGDKNHFVDLEAKRFKIDEIIAFCQEKGLAFFDTSTAIRRLQDNASDKFLEVVEPTDIPALLSQLPHLRAIVTTGEKATETHLRLARHPNNPQGEHFCCYSRGRGSLPTQGWRGKGLALSPPFLLSRLPLVLRQKG